MTRKKYKALYEEIRERLKELRAKMNYLPDMMIFNKDLWEAKDLGESVAVRRYGSKIYPTFEVKN